MQSLVPERCPNCLALGFMQIRVGGGPGQGIDRARSQDGGGLKAGLKSNREHLYF